MSQRVLRALLVIVAVTGCGQRPWWTATQMPTARPSNTFDAREIYRAMGLVVDTTALRFVASLRFIASRSPDSTLAAFGMSLANRSLSFHTEGSDFVAQYHVDVAFRADSGTVREVGRDETVRVHNVMETQRSDESIIFQEYIPVRPGIYTVSVVVRDQHSPAHSGQEIVDTVPRFDGPSLGGPIPIYEGNGRTQLGAFPELVINPRGTLLAGPDSLRFYVETYKLRPGTRIAARVIDRDTVELWHDTVTVGATGAGDGTLGTARIVIKPGELPLGRGDLELEAVAAPAGAHATGHVPFLVSFSDRWAVGTFDQMLNLLRYFDRQDLVTKLRDAPRTQRVAAWHAFSRATDTDPATPQNEALDAYYRRVELANRRFGEFTQAGWLTDRGEVFITLGEPDRMMELPGKMSANLRWEYDHPHVTLYFEDVSGLGQYKLTPESRTDYQTALGSIRKTS